MRRWSRWRFANRWMNSGFSVIGPYNRISEAMIALRNNQIDAAVLDVNLGGELIYPLADVLAADMSRSFSSPVTAPRRSSRATPTSRSCKSRSRSEP